MPGIYPSAAFLCFSLSHTLATLRDAQHLAVTPRLCDIDSCPFQLIDRVVVHPLQSHSSCEEVHLMTFFSHQNENQLVSESLMIGKKEKIHITGLYITFWKHCVCTCQHLLQFIFLFVFLLPKIYFSLFWQQRPDVFQWITLVPLTGL